VALTLIYVRHLFQSRLALARRLDGPDPPPGAAQHDKPFPHSHKPVIQKEK
jgi:hypothetical protein